MPPRAPDIERDYVHVEAAAAAAKSFSLDEVAKHNTPEDCWVIVRGKVYDVTKWWAERAGAYRIPRHPGGPVIYAKAGGECSQLFDSYHPLKARKTLEKFMIGDVKLSASDAGKVVQYEEDMDKGQFFHTLKQRVETFFSENKINPRVSYEMYAKSAIILSSMTFCYYMAFWYCTNLWAAAFFATFWGFWMAEVGVSIQHDANHGAYGTNTALGYFMGATLDMVGASSFMWRQQHVVGHHAFTNVDGLDPDIRVSDPDIRRVAPKQPHQGYQKFQHLYLAAAYGLLALKSVLADDFMALSTGHIGSVKIAQMTTVEKGVFWAGKAFFATYSVILPALYSHHSLAALLGLWLWGEAITGWVLACMFQVAHVISECEWPTMDPKTGKVAQGWAAAQMMTSADFAPGSYFWTHVSGGLNYQVVHHLFPGVCHCHYPKIAPIVTKTAGEFGIKHIVFPTFSEALTAHFGHLKRMGLGEGGIPSLATVG